MTFRNAMRLSFLNFDKVWKLILYRLVVWAIIIGLMSPCFFAISSAFQDFVGQEATRNFMLSGIFYTGSISDVCYAFIVEGFSFLSLLATNYLGILIYYAFLLLILLPTLMNMGRYVVGAMMYGYMSSHAKNGFCTTYLGAFGKAFVFGFFRALFNLCFNLSIFAVFYGLLNVPNGNFAYAMPYIFILVASLILTLKQLLVMGWAPSMIVCDSSSTRGFGFGIKTTFRRFGVSFASCFLIYLLSFVVFIGFGVYSLIVVVPVFSVVSSMTDIIMFFGNHGMKYYIDSETIISPKKHEQLDKINQIKFLL